MKKSDETSQFTDLDIGLVCVWQLRDGLRIFWQHVSGALEHPRPGDSKPIRGHSIHNKQDVKSNVHFVALMCEKSIHAFRWAGLGIEKLIEMRNAAKILDLDQMAECYLELINAIDVLIPHFYQLAPQEKINRISAFVLREIAARIPNTSEIEDVYWLDALSEQREKQAFAPVFVPTVPIEGAPQYSLDITNRTLEWFGERFESIERNPFEVIRVLYDAFEKGSQWVTTDKLRDLCPDVRALDRGMAEVFIVRVETGRDRNKKRVNTKHPVYEFIEKRGGAGAASYRLRPMYEIPV